MGLQQLRVILLALVPLAAAPLAHAASVTAPVTAIEYYNAALDHFFFSHLSPDIAAIESGRLAGWTRTGQGFLVFPNPESGGSAVSPVCRFYIPPQHGDSHFFSASAVECNDILARIPVDPMNASVAARLDRSIREALHRRIPGWTLEGFVATP